MEPQFDFDFDTDIKEEPSDEDTKNDSEDEPLVYHIEKKKKKHEPCDDPFKDLVEIKDEPLDEVETADHNIDGILKNEFGEQSFLSQNDDINDADFPFEVNMDCTENTKITEKLNQTKKSKKLKKKNKKKNGRLQKKPFETTCAMCLIEFKNKSELSCHMKEQHSKSESFVTCPFCEKRYNTNLGLKSHIRRKHGDSFQCEHCPKIFYKKDEFIAHLDATHCVKKEENCDSNFVCQECHQVFMSSDRLRIHQIRKHRYQDKSFTYKCDKCSMTYGNLASLGVHVRRKHAKRKEPLECSFCPEVFDNENDHGQHMLTVHTGGDFVANKETRCDICLLVFNSKSRLRNHMKNRHNKSIQAFKHQCPKCDASYDKILSLNCHMERKHNHLKSNVQLVKSCEGTTVVCQICSMIFTTDNRLKIHLQKKHKILDSTFKYACSKCDIRFTNTIALNRHVSKKHGPNSLYCVKCEIKFDSKQEYDKHEHKTPFHICNICQKVYHKEGMLSSHLYKEHQVKDTSEKNFNCQMCEDSFHSAAQLHYHIQKEHVNTVNKCQICEFTCSSYSSLRNHIIRTHNDTVKMQCLFCLQFSGSECELCEHIWKVHDLDYDSQNELKRTLPCPKCDERFFNLTSLHLHYKKDHADFDSVESMTICQHCGEILAPSKFKKHMDTHNKGVKMETKPRKCEFCDYISNSKTDLTFHLLRHASKELLHCDVEGCNFKTSYKSSLESHKVIKHKPRETLQCSKCTYQSSNKYLMKYHEDEHLTGRKKYNCDKCDYSTHLPASMSQHKYKHMDAKGFKCEQCPFATKYNTSLRQHIVKKHSDLTIDCPK